MPAKKSQKKSTKKTSKKVSKKTSSKITIVKDNRREVNWVLVLVMSAVFGALGVDRFIMGKIGTGILKLITFGGLGVWYLVDLILIAIKYDFKDVKWVD